MKNSWKCNQCGYLIQDNNPPEKCPSCQKDCTFIDVSCYTPDCGGPGSNNVDQRLIKTEPER